MITLKQLAREGAEARLRALDAERAELKALIGQGFQVTTTPKTHVTKWISAQTRAKMSASQRARWQRVRDARNLAMAAESDQALARAEAEAQLF